MIHSMTGFGEARLEDGGYAYYVEVRSVNNRYFKAAIHLPDNCGYLEPQIERWLRQRLARGSVTFRSQIRALGATAAEQVNADVLRSYVQQLASTVGSDSRTVIDLAALLALPGALEPHDLSERERSDQERIFERLTGEALERLLEMRAREGESLERDLIEHCGRMKASIGVIRERAPRVVEEYRDRLHVRIGQLLAGSGVELAPADLLKEVSIYAERSDISEELSRLDAHLDQFECTLKDREPPGRKLEFIAQEMLREANTIGSKTGDAEIARAMVEIKSAVDRIKEQVQNAE